VSPSDLPCCLEQRRRGIAPGGAAGARYTNTANQTQTCNSPVKPRFTTTYRTDCSLTGVPGCDLLRSAGQPHTARRFHMNPRSIVQTQLRLLILLTWRIWWVHNKASKRQMGFNSVFKGLTWNLGRLPTLLWPSQNHPTNHQNDSLKEVGERVPSSHRSF
jgi:hypothetical protein